VGDLLLQPVQWLLFGPAEGVLSSPVGALVAVPAVCLAAVAAGAMFAASYDQVHDRLSVSARHGLVTAALVVAVHAPHQTGAGR
jgi:hypothetical protein